MADSYSIDTYNEKRDFRSTPEPKGKRGTKKGRHFVIQKHDATRLHYDFRLEMDGVLKSWAVTKGPSLDPSEKRLAVRTEDHPLDYRTFEGTIPSGYGKGEVILWDRGTWTPKGDPEEDLKKGELKFELDGERLKGGFVLVLMKNNSSRKKQNWLLIKEKDGKENRDIDVTEKYTDSVETGRTIEDIEKGRGAGKRRKPSKSKLPEFTPPQLAKLYDDPPKGENWVHEIKYDGYRLQALCDGDGVRLITRNGKDWTDKYPSIADALEGLRLKDTALDGELVALRKDGSHDFGALQNNSRIPVERLRFYIFDVLHHDGEDLRELPLSKRNKTLEKLVPEDGPVRLAEHLDAAGDDVYGHACRLGLEGIISKKLDAPYRTGRSTTWRKIKCSGNDDYVIGGYRKSSVKGRPFSSLLLGEPSADGLIYRGRVGTGFDEETLKSLAGKLSPLERKTSPFKDLPAEAKRGAVFVTPRLIAQVTYTEQTSDGLLRHPSFIGLREDKETKDSAMAETKEETGPVQIAGVRLTHPDRVLFPDQGLTKRDLAEYYEAYADYLLPHMADRPLSLVRCPEGRGKECFFQKHHTRSTPDALDSVEIEESSGKKASYLVIRDVGGLVATAQIGALEIHPWGARTDRLDRPERVVFDLDPDESLPFSKVRDAAVEMRDLIASADLKSVPLVTGGKGIHVIVPIERRRGWDDIKTFAKHLAEALSAAAPDRYLAKASKASRKGKIFIDWLRNERGATAIAPYSPRAREGAPFAMPVSWDELGKLKAPNSFHLDEVKERLSGGGNPWSEIEDVRQTITNSALAAVKELARERS